MGADRQDVGQEIEVPFLNVGASGGAVAPVEILFDKFVGLAEVDAVDAVTAVHLRAQLFQAQPPVADFMIRVAEGDGTDHLFAVDDFLFIPSGLVQAVFDHVFAQWGFLSFAAENGFDCHDLFVIVIHFQHTGVEDAEQVPHLGILPVAGNPVFAEFQVDPIGGLGVNGAGIVIDALDDVLEVFGDLVVLDHLVHHLGQLFVFLFGLDQGGFGLVQAVLHQVNFLLGHQPQLVQTGIIRHVHLAPNLVA